MTNTIESYVDVLVIGAGPSGLMCAYGLAKAGVNVRVIDKRADKIATGQADGVQPIMMEVLQSYGLGERFLREATQLHIAAFYNPSANEGIELTARIADITAPTARYPFEATLDQGSIESIFLDSMHIMDVEVERPLLPTLLEISEEEIKLISSAAYPIKVVLKHLSDEQSKTEIVNAKFVVGADGAHSWVRNAMGIQMEGEQTNFMWGVIDMVPDTNFPDIRNKCAIHSNNGSCIIIPREGDKVRFYIQLSENGVVDEDGRADRSKIGPHQVLEVARKSMYPYTIETPEQFEWWTVYIIGQRVASQFAIKERVFIVGDACHTHSPNAGQGMNASMNDAHNLIWKLTYVLRGWSNINLLKSYEFERRNYAQELIDFDKKFAALFSSKPQSLTNPDGVSGEVFLKAYQTYSAFTSGITIHYAPSAIVNISHQSCASHLTIGQRMPPQIVIRAADSRPFELQDLIPSDTRFKVLVFTGDTSQPIQRSRLEKLATEMGRPEGFMQRFTPPRGKKDSVFDILSISSANKLNVKYNELPALFRSHWSKVLLDDTDAQGTVGGKIYTSFGVVPSGAVVIIRPDGYVGMIAPFDKIVDIDTYFASFMEIHRK